MDIYGYTGTLLPPSVSADGITIDAVKDSLVVIPDNVLGDGAGRFWVCGC
jgi:hypothetical protein